MHKYNDKLIATALDILIFFSQVREWIIGLYDLPHTLLIDKYM